MLPGLGGSSRPLAACRDRIQHLHVFSQRHWADAWEQQRRRLKLSKQEAEAAGLPMDQLQAIAESCYHGPVPAPDAELLQTWVRRVVGEDEAALRKGPFLEAVRAARREAEASLRCPPPPRSTPSDGPNRSSSKAPKLGPRDVYCQPLTTQQDIGWEASQVKAVAPAGAGRKSSEQTKHVAAMLQQGYYF